MNMLGLLEQVGVFIAGVFFTLLLTIVFQKPVEGILVRIFGGYSMRSRRDIRGLWLISYTYTTSGTELTEYLLVDIKQLGRTFRGVSKNSEYGKYVISGDIESETYITGKWESRIEDDIHNGSFQTVLTHSGKSASGKWIGFNSELKVLDGPQNWIKLTNIKTDRKIIINTVKSIGILRYIQEASIKY